LSTPLEQRESEIVALFLKYHPAATADEIAKETKMEKVEVYYCLNVLLERSTAAINMEKETGIDIELSYPMSSL